MRSRRVVRVVGGAMLPLLVLAAGIAATRAADPSALWRIVNGQCVPHQQQEHRPSPCITVDLTRGVAVMKDIRGAAQVLVIPTVRIGGIDDPAILPVHAVNYWDDAWRARREVEARLGRPQGRDAIVLAINSAWGRSQNQLHIHVDCVRPDVRAALAENLDKVGTAWTPFPIALAGQHYRAMRIDGEAPGSVNPFRVLSDSHPGIVMARHTLVLVGEDFPDGKAGFVLLDDQVDLPRGDLAAGEQLQDHGCTVAGSATGSAR